MMERHFYRVALGAAVAALFLAGQTRAQDPESTSDLDSEIVRGKPVDAGYVILDGKYLPPPYILEKRGDDLWVNGQLLDAGWFGRMRGGWRTVDNDEPEDEGHGQGFGHRRFGQGGPWGGPRGGPWGGPRGARMQVPSGKVRLTNLEDCLRVNFTFIGGDGYRGFLLPRPEAATLVEILLSGESSQKKAELIENDIIGPARQAAWQQLIATFEPSAELAERMQPEIDRLRQVEKENEAKHKAAVASVFWSSPPVKYVITLAAMGLVVAACGTLLTYRPQSRVRWSEVDATGDGIPVVVRTVVLLFFLGVFDLGATLVAQQAGGFTEMNPLGSHIVESPMLLAIFKLATLLMACTILYALRRYRGAQVAAWWMCLLCTVLTFRWLTYNSMFMT